MTKPMEIEADNRLAEEFKAMVLKRTGLAPQDLSCPRERSDMTPCLARDGACVIAYVHASPSCVGCGADLRELHAAEKAREEQ